MAARNGDDPTDFDEEDIEDAAEPGLQHGETHTRRPERSEALQATHGKKTRARIREIVKKK